MKQVLVIIGVVMVLLLFGTMMVGIRSAQTDERTDPFAAVATGVGETTADVVLVADIYDNDLLSVTDIVSDNALDAPLPDAFVPATNTLTVRGLNASDTRDLDVTYLYGVFTGDAAPAGTFLNYLPIFVIIAIVIIVVGVMWAAFSRR